MRYPVVIHKDPESYYGVTMLEIWKLLITVS